MIFYHWRRSLSADYGRMLFQCQCYFALPVRLFIAATLRPETLIRILMAVWPRPGQVSWQCPVRPTSVPVRGVLFFRSPYFSR